MATTALSVIRRRVAEQLSDWTPNGTTSGAGNAGGTTAVDSALSGYPDITFPGYWLLLTSGTNVGEARIISVFTSSTGTITVTRAFTAQVASGVTYEIHKYEPADYTAAANRVAEESFGDLYLPIENVSLVVDNRLANGDFETAIAAADWTSVGSPTLTYDTTIKMWRTRSAKLVAGGSAGQLTQAPQLNIKELTGKTAVLEGWGYATAANVLRFRLDWDGTNFANGTYHTGEDRWESDKLRVSAAVPSTATQVKAICEVAANGTGYFDGMALIVDDIYRYALPTTIVRGPNFVGVQRSKENPDDGYVPWPYVTFEDNSGTRSLRFTMKPAPGYRIQLKGEGVLTTLSADADTIELGVPEINWLILQTALRVLTMAEGKPRTNMQAIQGKRQSVNDALAKLAFNPLARMHKPGAIGYLPFVK